MCWLDNRKKIKMEVPVSGAKITDSDKAILHRVVNNRWYTDGEYHRLFSRELAKKTGARHVTLCNSGSSALLLAINACNEDFQSLKRGKRFIITCATGFPTTIATAIQSGFIPYFVDIDRKTLQIDPEVVADLMNVGEVAGVVVAHTLGFPFRADYIAEEKFLDQFLIEDCADALGARLDNLPVGSFGNAATYSFFPAHHITTGEGGAVTTNNGKLHAKIQSYNNWGRDCWCKPGEQDTCNKRFCHQMGDLPYGYDHKYIFSRLGYNLKMTEFQAGLGYSQIGRLDNIIRRRKNNFHDIYSIFYDYEELDLIVWDYENSVPSPFGFPIVVNEKAKFTAKNI